jgi:hypothetical protein
VDRCGAANTTRPGRCGVVLVDGRCPHHPSARRTPQAAREPVCGSHPSADPFAPDGPAAVPLSPEAAFLLQDDIDGTPIPTAPTSNRWHHAGAARWDDTRGRGNLPGAAVHIGTPEQARTRLETARRREPDAAVHEFEIVGPMHREVIHDIWANFAAHGEHMEGLNDVADVLFDAGEDVPGYDPEDDDRGANSDLSRWATIARAELDRGGFYYANAVEGEGVSAVVPDTSWLARP